MRDDIDVLSRECQEHYAHARHHETQRATLANFILLIEGGILAFIASKESARFEFLWLLPVVLIVLGVFGAMFSLKHYERFRYHQSVAGKLRHEIETRFGPAAPAPGPAMGGPLPLQALRASADVQHKRKWYYEATGRIHLYTFWVALHVLVMVLGIILLYLILNPAPPPRPMPPASGDRQQPACIFARLGPLSSPSSP